MVNLKILPKYHRPLLLLLFLVLLLLRSPNLLIAPRFFAEEGIVFFKYAWEHNVMKSLFFVWWDLGYFLFFTNIVATIAANLVPLEYAPFATTYMALLVQFIPFLIIIYAESPYFGSIYKKILIGSVVLFAPMINGEIWLNTTNSQVFFGLIAALILLEDVNSLSAIKKWAYRFLLLLGGLSGVYASMLAPAFAYRFWKQRTKERMIQLFILGVSLAVQGTIAMFAIFVKGLALSRGNEGSIANIVENLSVDFIGIPLFGNQLARQISALFLPIGDYIFSFLLLFIIISLLLISKKTRQKLSDRSKALLATLIFCSVVIPMTSKFGGIGGRYSVVPGSVFLLFLVDNVHLHRRRWFSFFLLSLLLLSVSIGIVHYRNDGFSICDGAYPNSWRLEVLLWRKNPHHNIRICPTGLCEIAGEPVMANSAISLDPHGMNKFEQISTTTEENQTP